MLLNKDPPDRSTRDRAITPVNEYNIVELMVYKDQKSDSVKPEKAQI